MTEPLLRARGLNVAYRVASGRLPALHDVDLDVAPGEIVGVVGESGCGKSTLAASLLQLLPPNGEVSGGSVTFGGRDVLALSREQMRQVRGRELAMIFQDPLTSLNPTFTVGDQMLTVLRAHRDGGGRDRRPLKRRAVAMLEQVGIPDAEERFSHYPHQFSGGMRQRIMIAMALMLEPRLLIADEATSALDVTLEAQILELLRRLRDEHGTAILFVSHDLGVVSQLCQRVVVMYAGRAVEEADVISLFEEPRHPYTRALLQAVPSRNHRGRRLATIPGRVPVLSALPDGCKFADRCPLVQDRCRSDEPRYLNLGGRHVRCVRHDAAAAPNGEVRGERVAAQPVRQERVVAHNGAEPLVTVRGLETHFVERRNPLERLLGAHAEAVRAVDGVDLEIGRGEVFGLVGESGSGKTTLGRTILGLTAPTQGQVVIGGQDMSRLSRHGLRQMRRRVQMIFQDPYSSLSPRKRVGTLLTEPYTINGLPASEHLSVATLLEMVELSEEQANKYPHELSGGQARRVGIARALALTPELIVADEPTSGLDVSAAAAVLNLMKDLGKELSLTYLVITHDLNMVGYIADRIAVMYLGQLVEVGPADDLFDNPTHPYTRGLLDSISEPNVRSRRSERRLLVPGEIPSPKNPPSGCRFHTRCAYAKGLSFNEQPELEPVGPDHHVACHYWRQIRAEAPVRPIEAGPRSSSATHQQTGPP